MIITSPQNQKIKDVVKLRDRRSRDSSDLFLIEGYREILRAVEGGVQLDSLFFCPQLFLGSNEKSLIERIEASHYQCVENVFRKISYRDRPDGLLAVAKQKHLQLEELVLKENPFLVIAEAIEKPGNLGTILRSCDAVGIDALIVSDRCTDIYNPNVVRASVGTLFTVPVVEAEGKEILPWLKAKGISIVAATPHAKINYTDAPLAGGIAIAVGTEQYGLSPLWMEQADIQVSLPMRGAADSLNVATATTVLLYEALRQRKLFKG